MVMVVVLPPVGDMLPTHPRAARATELMASTPKKRATRKLRGTLDPTFMGEDSSYN